MTKYGNEGTHDDRQSKVELTSDLEHDDTHAQCVRDACTYRCSSDNGVYSRTQGITTWPEVDRLTDHSTERRTNHKHWNDDSEW